MAQIGESQAKTGCAKCAGAHVAAKPSSSLMQRNAEKSALSHPKVPALNRRQIFGRIGGSLNASFCQIRSSLLSKWYVTSFNVDTMDTIDQRLITCLRHNARRSISDLSLELGLSRATVRARINRLERDRDILGYSVVVKGDADASPVRGIMLIEIEGRSTDQVIKALSGFAEIVAIHTTNGRWDLVVESGASDLMALDVALRRIRLLPAIKASETNLLLSTSRSVRT